MSVGFPVNKAVIDNRTGHLVRTLRETFEGLDALGSFLDGKTDAELIAEFEYSQDDVTLLKSAITDLRKLGRIAHGQDVQAEASDFLFFARRLTGIE